MRKKAVKLFLVIITLAMAGAAGQAMGDDDDHHDDDDGRGFFLGGGWKGSADVAKVEFDMYKKECGSCHFAYQPGFLPERSWEKVMAGLDDHFGDNAELFPEDHEVILDYLRRNSAEKSGHKASVKITRSLRGMEAPLRITTTPYFTHEHDEIPRRYWADNPKVKSLSMCDRCHTNADQGYFNEHEVDIPGVGRWDD
ncbi:MAG: diheme cytochrome c [Candidatus Nitrospinota bacterium M3_3B_026]